MPSADGEPTLVRDEVSSTTIIAVRECPSEGKEDAIVEKEAKDVDAQNNGHLTLAEAPEFVTKEMLDAVVVALTESSETAHAATAAESLSSSAVRSRADEQCLASTEQSATANNLSDPAEKASDASQSCSTAAAASALVDALPAAESSTAAAAAAAASMLTVAAASASSVQAAASVPAAAVDQAAPPDGGWGWMVVFASFVIHIIIDGISYTFGVFMDAYAEHFDCGAAQASALMSTLLGVYMLSGPLAAGLIRKFGARAVGVSGSLLAAAAFVASTFSPNIEVMLLLYGVVGGIGLGLMYMPSVISVGHYFDKKRTIAMGIAMSGTGFGTILFGQVGVLLLEVYDWKNTHYILAGVLLNGAVFSSLIRPRRVKAAPTATKTTTKRAIAAGAVQNSAVDSPATCSITIIEARDACDTRRSSVNDQHPVAIQTGSRDVTVNSSSALPISYRRNNLQRLRFVIRFAWLFYNGRVVNNKMSEVPAKKPAEQREARLAERQTSGVVALVRKVIRIVATDMALFKDRAFLTVAVAAFLAQIAFVIPYGFTVEKAKEMGTSDADAASLLSYLGIANAIGLLGSSAIAQIPWMRTLPVHNVFLGIASLFMIMTPLATSYPELVVCAAGYGLFIGGHVTLPPIFLCEILGLEKLNTSFGLLTLIRGVALFIGPILAGSIYDTMGSYDDAFYVGGSLALLSTLLFCLLFHKSVRYSAHKC